VPGCSAPGSRSRSAPSPVLGAGGGPRAGRGPIRRSPVARIKDEEAFDRLSRQVRDMWIKMLGPLQLLTGTAWTAIRAAQPHLVLAVLLVEAGQIVTTDPLVYSLFGAKPPSP